MDGYTHGRTHRAMAASKRILCVGLACLDLISVVDEYPLEDTDQKCSAQHWNRGGNASNSCTVLSLLGARCEFLGTFADTQETLYLKNDFLAHGITCEHCVIHPGCKCPIAVCIMNKESGSRTIIAPQRDLPEMTYEDFQNIDLSSGLYKWIHFEGRYNCEEIKLMLQHIERYNCNVQPSDRITTSVELEKRRRDIDMLLKHADYVFVSKDHAKLHDCYNKQEAVETFVKKIRKGATVICPWGESGVAAVRQTDPSHVYEVHAYSPAVIVDTLGAGDCFNAAMIFALCSGKSLEESMHYGSRIAGAKCGISGFSGLKDIIEEGA